EQGITLIEVLAALVISTFLIGTILFFTHYTQSNVQKISTRETILKESRLILNQIVAEARNHLAIASTDSQYVLKLDRYEFYLDGPSRKFRYTGDYTYVHFDPGTHTVTLEKKENAATIKQELSHHVQDLTITTTAYNETRRVKININITMLLPNNETYQAGTVVYIADPKEAYPDS